jgi:hypothetical protein
MNDNAPSTVVLMSIEIEIPNDLSEELQDALVEDLTYEDHINRLSNLIQKWARFISGEACHVSIDVE